MKAIAVVILAGLLTACEKPPTPVTGAEVLDPGANVPDGKEYTVKITWHAEDRCIVKSLTEDSTKCKEPKILGLGPEPGPAFCVGRTDFVIWQSDNPPNAVYEIFFDPFRGTPLKAEGNGRIKKRIEDKAPIADYKYSIVRDGCEPNKVNTKDPYIRVDK